MKLNQLVSIASGVNGKRNPQGDVFYLGASDFLDSHTIDPFIKPSLINSPKWERHYLNIGDVIVLSKGHHDFSAYYLDGNLNPVVASSVFLVLRDIKPNVLPQYLVWYINLETTQNELKNYARGSALPAINRKILGELQIDVPAKEVQKNIVSLSRLKKEETELLQKLDYLKSAQLESLLKTKIQNS